MVASRTRRIPRIRIAVGVAGVSLLATACGGSSGGGQGSAPGASGQTVPTANLPVLRSIGKGEGQLNLIAWEGYLNPIWVKPFEQLTGCQVNAKYAGSSDEDGLADEERVAGAGAIPRSAGAVPTEESAQLVR